MSSIGPQLPPHLQKRKRTPESHAGRDSPPTKVTRRSNEDEIALDDDSSADDFGPSIGPAAVATTLATGPANNPSKAVAEKTTRPRPSTGPAPPPACANKDEISLSDGEDGQGISSSTPAAHPQAPAPAPRRIIGPAPPPGNLSEYPTTNPNPSSDSDSDSDSDFGPAAAPTDYTTARTSHATNPLSSSSASAPAQPPKRDDWMLAPPAPARAAAAPDPTKMRSRKFASGRAAAASESHAGGVSSIWTETPEEKARRLADAVLGRGGDAGEGRSAGKDKGANDRGKRGGGGGGGGTVADEERIRSYTEQTRGKSMYEEHQVRRKVVKEGGDGQGAEAEEEDDPSKRAFNWEKDMKAGATISHSQRRELLTKSANFGGRFEKGSYL